MKALVIGYGVSGKSAEKFLLSKGYEVSVFDDQKHFLWKPNILEFDLVVVSPGIRSHHHLYQKAIEEDIPIIGELELGLRYLPAHIKIIGITGTNGKTTTTNLIAHIFRATGKKIQAVGNVGLPLTEFLLRDEKVEYLAIEISSFQIETLHSKRLDCIVITNITPDHLDAYDSFNAYAQTKIKLINHKKPSAAVVVSRNVQPFINDYEAIFCDNDNYAIATQVADCFSISDAQAALKTFQVPQHRIQFIGNIDDISFYNDSKSTTPESTVYAIKQLKRPIVLLAGGSEKNLSFDLWKHELNPYVKNIIAYGECAYKIKNAVYSKVAVELQKDLHSAFACARKYALKGDCILLSPGCASLDQFKNYEERGNVFMNLVNELKKGPISYV